MMVSHRFSRLFDTKPLHPPRDFVLPDEYLTDGAVLEIGAGKGKHALMLAQDYPDKHIFALERTVNKAKAFDGNHAPSHLHFIHADAIAWSVFALPPACLSAVYILYPNPEPKNPNQRFVNMPFFEFLLSRMQSNATLTLASNIGDYITEACDKLEHVWQLPYVCQVIDTTSARTHFEIKYLSRGELCQEVVAVKPDNYRTRFDEMLPKVLS